MQIRSRAGNGISQTLARVLGKSGKLETAGSEAMSGKQIVGRKDGASRETAYMIADGLRATGLPAAANIGKTASTAQCFGIVRASERALHREMRRRQASKMERVESPGW